MLSGHSPFLVHRAKDDTALNIMKRIKSGDFKLDSDPNWKYVSPAAKQLVKGLLTVDPKKRLNLDHMFNSSWIKLAEQRGSMSSNSSSSAGHGALMTPAVLSERPIDAHRDLMQTFNAFHRVTREGGLPTLKTPVNNNHLKQSSKSLASKQLIASLRRTKQNKNSSSTSSGCSSMSSISNSSASLSPTKQLFQTPWMFPQPSSNNSNGSPASAAAASSSSSSSTSYNSSDIYSSFQPNSRIHDYLTSLSQIQQAQQQAAARLIHVSSSSQHLNHHQHKSSSSSSISSSSSTAAAITTGVSSSSRGGGTGVPAVQPPIISEALSGVSYRLLPADHPAKFPTPLTSQSASAAASPSVSIRKNSSSCSSSSSSQSAVSITPVPIPRPILSIPSVPLHYQATAVVTSTTELKPKYGPMTRSRKRKLKDPIMSPAATAAAISPSAPGSLNLSSYESSGVSITAISEPVIKKQPLAHGHPIDPSSFLGGGSNGPDSQLSGGVSLTAYGGSPSPAAAATAAVSVPTITID